jgi:hypothetical protein
MKIHRIAWSMMLKPFPSLCGNAAAERYSEPNLFTVLQRSR